jgi:hypothetical protein
MSFPSEADHDPARPPISRRDDAPQRFPPRTIEADLAALVKLSRHFNRSLDQLDAEGDPA